jgi:hypothetical protein
MFPAKPLLHLVKSVTLCHFCFLLHLIAFSCLVPQVFELVESFRKPSSLTLAQFSQVGGIAHCVAGFSKENCSSGTYLADLKTD